MEEVAKRRGKGRVVALSHKEAPTKVGVEMRLHCKVEARAMFRKGVVSKRGTNQSGNQGPKAPIVCYKCD